MLGTVQNLLLFMLKRKQAPKAAIISLPPHKWNEKIETLSPSCFVFMYTADSWDSKMAPQWTCCIDIPSWIKVHFVAHTWSASGATWLMWLDCKEHLPRSLSTQPLHEVHHCEKGNHTESDMLWEAQVYQMEICEERKMPGQFSVISATFVVVCDIVGIFKDYVWTWALLSPVSIDPHTGNYMTINIRKPPNKAHNHQLLLNKPIQLVFLVFSSIDS